MIRKQGPHIPCLQETHLKSKDTHRLKVKRWKRIFHANGKEKKAGVAVLTSNKIDFQKRKGIHNDKGNNATRRHAPFLCLDTQILTIVLQ